jgi:hypothetical protein
VVVLLLSVLPKQANMILFPVSRLSFLMIFLQKALGIFRFNGIPTAVGKLSLWTIIRADGFK